MCQWFHFEDQRLDDAVRWMKSLGVTYLRTGLSWADSFRPNAQAWFDRQMSALEPFNVTLTFCFTPEHLGVAPHHTSRPRQLEPYAELCAEMVRRYASGVEPDIIPFPQEQFGALESPFFVCVTDGAPRHVPERESYGRARREEARKLAYRNHRAAIQGALCAGRWTSSTFTAWILTITCRQPLCPNW